MTECLPKLITLEKAIAQAKADPNTPTIEKIMANFDNDVKEFEEDYGSHAPTVFLHLIPQPITDPKYLVVSENSFGIHNRKLREPNVTFEDSIRMGMVASYLARGTTVVDTIAQASRR